MSLHPPPHRSPPLPAPRSAHTTALPHPTPPAPPSSAAPRASRRSNTVSAPCVGLDALRAGIRWEFQTFAEYQDFLRKNRPYLNVATLIGHSAVRSAVMGEAGSEIKVPSPEQLGKMRELVRDALRHGAIGFASSWSPNHSGFNGVPMPSTIASEGEVRSLAQGAEHSAETLRLRARFPISPVRWSISV